MCIFHSCRFWRTPCFDVTVLSRRYSSLFSSAALCLAQLYNHVGAIIWEEKNMHHTITHLFNLHSIRDVIKIKLSTNNHFQPFLLPQTDCPFLFHLFFILLPRHLYSDVKQTGGQFQRLQVVLQLRKCTDQQSSGIKKRPSKTESSIKVWVIIFEQ